MRITHVGLALLMASFTVGCGEDGSTGPVAIPTSISVSPNDITFDAIGQERQLSATVRDQSGNIMQDAPVEWSTSNNQVLEISQLGLAKSIDNGAATISALAGEATGTAVATVDQIPSQMVIQAPVYNVEPGDTLRLSGHFTDANGYTVASAEVNDWTSSDTLVATVSDSGLVTGTGEGTANIRAGAAGPLADSVTISVAPMYDGEDPAEVTTDTANDSGSAAVFTRSFGGRRLASNIADSAGIPIPASVLEYSESTGRSMLFIDPGDSTLAGALLFGHPDSIDVWFTQSAEVGFEHDGSSFTTNSWDVYLRDGAMAFSQYAEVLDQFVWDFANADSIACLTYQEAAALAKARAGFTLEAATIILSVGAYPGIQYVTKGFSLTEDFAGLDVSDIAWLLIEGLDEYSGLPVTDTLSTRVRVIADFVDPRSFGAKYRNVFMSIRFDPDDDYCRGRIPAILTSPTSEISGPGGSNVSATVNVTSDWGNGVEGVTVHLELEPSGGSLSSETATTDSSGAASVVWTFPSEPGSYQLTVSASHDGEPLSGSPLYITGNVTEAYGWAEVTGFPGTARMDAVGFVIEGEAYVGTGQDQSDMWRYAPTTDAWTQMADLPGAGREEAIAFAIDGLGYIGTGEASNGSALNDFWQYDPAANTWTERSSFGGGGRKWAFAFALAGHGYVGGGYGNGYKKDLWAYDPATDSWSQLSDFGGGKRGRATAFAIGSTAYVALGHYYDSYYGYHQYYNDLWAYDSTTDRWVQKSSYPGAGRLQAMGFVIGQTGYLGTGYSPPGADGRLVEQSDMWKYDPASNTWVQEPDFGGGVRAGAVGLAVGETGFVGLGAGEYGGLGSDWWVFGSGY